ncbi:MAG: cupin domain-containing protein [Pseudomonadota bacterium]
MDRTRGYEIKRRDLVAESTGLRVQILTIGAGQCVPWHRHSLITDTFVCLDGPMKVETRAPDETTILNPGETYAVPPLQDHRVSGQNDGPCRFLIVQGVGEYDFVPS